MLGASAYEVVIGGNGNTKSRILKDMSTNETADEADTPEILHCNQYKVSTTSHTCAVLQ